MSQLVLTSPFGRDCLRAAGYFSSQLPEGGSSSWGLEGRSLPRCLERFWASGLPTRGPLLRHLLLPPLAQGIPLHTRTPCYSAATAASRRSRTSEPSYSSPHGLPLSRLPRLHVVPFLGLTV